MWRRVAWYKLADVSEHNRTSSLCARRYGGACSRLLIIHGRRAVRDLPGWVSQWHCEGHCKMVTDSTADGYKILANSTTQTFTHYLPFSSLPCCSQHALLVTVHSSVHSVFYCSQYTLMFTLCTTLSSMHLVSH